MPTSQEKNNLITKLLNFFKSLWENEKLTLAFKINVTLDMLLVILSTIIISPNIIALFFQGIIEIAKIVTGNNISNVSFLLSQTSIMIIFFALFIKALICLVYVKVAGFKNNEDL